MFRRAGRSLDNRASRSSCSFCRRPSVYCRPECEHICEIILVNAHLLPGCLLFGKRVQRFIQWISDDSSHRHIPSPIRINTCLPEQMHKRLLALLDRREPVVWDDRVFREVRTRGEHARRRKRQTTCTCTASGGSDGEIDAVLAVGLLLRTGL
jgi:hypothetical protein